MLFPTLLILLVLPVLANTLELVLHHRIYAPSSSSPWSQRATIFNNSSFIPSDSYSTVMSSFSPSFTSPLALYQIALQRPTDTSPNNWHIVSINACLIPTAHSESILFHTHRGIPFSFSYALSPLSIDASCASVDEHNRQQASLQTSVAFSSAQHPPSPILRTPPPLTPAGQPVQPVPEKSFLQKYGLYLGLFSLVIFLAGGSEEDTSQGGTPAQSK